MPIVFLFSYGCVVKHFPVDYRFVDVNPAFERITGLHASGIGAIPEKHVQQRFWKRADQYGGSIVDANHAATKFCGWSVDKLKSMSIFDITTISPGEHSDFTLPIALRNR